MLRAQDPAWLATLTSEKGAQGTGMSAACPAGCSLQRGLRALEFVFVGQRRRGRETKGLAVPRMCYGRHPAAMRGTRLPARLPRGCFKASSQTSLINPPSSLKCLLCVPRTYSFYLL